MKYAFWLFFALVSGVQIAQALDCPDDKTAEEATDQLHSWRDVHQFFKRYRNCYDGSVAEGAEDKIHLLWADHWSTLPEMIAITNKDRQFKKFIWQRISDETFSRDEFERVVRRAQAECPKVARSFCRALLSEAEKAKQIQ
jgi:hypothetical protein